MALRLDFVPSSFTLIQLDFPPRSLRKSDGGSLRLIIRMSTSPSLSKSPNAHPRLQCAAATPGPASSVSSSKTPLRSEEHTSELQSRLHLVCRLLLEKKTATRAGALSPLPNTTL